MSEGCELPCCPVLGVGVTPVDLTAAVDRVESWIGRGHREYICVTGVHGVMECQRDPHLRDVHNRAGMVVPDGMPLVWISKARGFKDVSRVYGPDFMLRVCERTLHTGRRHYFYGGAEGVPELLKEALEARFPGLQVVGTHSPPFRELTDAEVLEVAAEINCAAPDVVWVGLSTPKQERWMDRLRPHLDASALIGVGAAFDFHAGLKPQAPDWMKRVGLEWLFRMASEPRRLGPRYLRNNPTFVGRLIVEELGRALGRLPMAPGGRVSS